MTETEELVFSGLELSSRSERGRHVSGDRKNPLPGWTFTPKSPTVIDKIEFYFRIANDLPDVPQSTLIPYFHTFD